MKKILPIILIILILCGCSKQPVPSASEPEKTAIVKLPQDDTVNGYRKPVNSNTSESTYKYYANTKTQKFHTADCKYAKKTSSENLYTSSNREEMIEKGYEPCKICKP